MAEMVQTRVSLGSQLREALDEMQKRGQVQGWAIIGTADGRQAYRIVDGYGNVDELTAGEVMAWVNAYGFDVRFGKDPREAVRPEP